MAERYRESLVRYLADGGEAGLEAAYGHGRRAVAEQRSVIEFAVAHHDALAAIEHLGPVVIERAGAFLAEALSAFEASQVTEPNRFRGFYGAGRAAELAGDLSKARTHYTALVALAEQADTERPELKQARAFVAQR